MTSDGIMRGEKVAGFPQASGSLVPDRDLPSPAPPPSWIVNGNA